VAAFSFRLEKVLRYRANMEKKVRVQLSETLTEVKHLETLIARLGQRRTKAAEALAHERLGGISACRDQLHASFLLGLAQQAENEGGELEKSMGKLEILRKLLVIAAAKKKSIESLKESHRERYKRECEHKEQKLLDDLALMARREGER